MTTVLSVILLLCSVLLSGCGRAGQSPEDLPPEKEPPQMIQIQNLTVTDKILTLDYRVSNPFEDAIWVCYDTWVHGERDVQDVTTRIEGETVRIKLCFNLGRARGFENPPAIAKYVLLPHGESCSGKIVLDLPIRDYLREERAERKEHKEIVLHRVIFEIGYIGAFGPKWDALLDSWSEKMKEGSIESKPRAFGPYCVLPVNPLITEETLDGQSREVMYLEEHTSLVQKEESAEAPIADVNIPCSVVVEDQ